MHAGTEYISDAQYPHPAYLPQNVRLQILDNDQPDPPEKLQGTFDIVHLRLWLGNVQNGDPTTVLEHALKLLRGYLQWAELDPLRGIAEGPNGEISPHVTNILNFTQKIKDHRWIERLPELLKKHNLGNIEEVFAFEKPWQTKLASDMSCAVGHEMENTGSPYIADKLKTYPVSIPLAHAEVSKGATLVQPFA